MRIQFLILNRPIQCKISANRPVGKIIASPRPKIRNAFFNSAICSVYLASLNTKNLINVWLDSNTSYGHEHVAKDDNTKSFAQILGAFSDCIFYAVFLNSNTKTKIKEQRVSEDTPEKQPETVTLFIHIQVNEPSEVHGVDDVYYELRIVDQGINR